MARALLAWRTRRRLVAVLMAAVALAIPPLAADRGKCCGQNLATLRVG